MDLSFLPSVNASLNAVASVLLIAGFIQVRRGRIEVHRRLMVAAFATSCLFLVLYVAHKVSRNFENTPFLIESLRPMYLGILASHVILAAAVPGLAITLIVLGRRGRIVGHRRLARWAWPIWMYVSVTGVVIYWMLYHLSPQAGGMP